MIMNNLTISDAIQILDPKTTSDALYEIKYYGGFEGKERAIETVNQACKIACDIMCDYRKDKHMLYRITKITHAGTCGEKGTNRTDGRYPLRIGRIVEMKYDSIEISAPMTLHYVRDSDGSPLIFKYIRTSDVVSKNKNNNKVVITTRNSVFEFEEYEEE